MVGRIVPAVTECEAEEAEKRGLKKPDGGSSAPVDFTGAVEKGEFGLIHKLVKLEPAKDAK